METSLLKDKLCMYVIQIRFVVWYELLSLMDCTTLQYIACTVTCIPLLEEPVCWILIYVKPNKDIKPYRLGIKVGQPVICLKLVGMKQQ